MKILFCRNQEMLGWLATENSSNAGWLKIKMLVSSAER
jgi:hypothetical protein